MKEKERRATFQLSFAVSSTKSSNRNEMRVWNLGRACRGIDAISLQLMQHNQPPPPPPTEKDRSILLFFFFFFLSILLLDIILSKFKIDFISFLFLQFEFVFFVGTNVKM
jgi:hypothetical protein